jgi:dihydroneopterin aldolase
MIESTKQNNLSKITVSGIEVRAKHGVNPDEKIYPQRFVCDVEIVLDVTMSAKSDDVNNTVNYADVVNVVQKVLNGESKNLLETLASDILDAVKKLDANIERAKVTLHKPDAPIPAKFADVKIEVQG